MLAIRVELATVTSSSLIYSYELDSSHPNKLLSFQIRENELWFTYHNGGVIMGYDLFVKVSNDGKAEVQHQGYLDFRNTPFGTLIINQSVPPSGHLSKELQSTNAIERTTN